MTNIDCVGVFSSTNFNSVWDLSNTSVAEFAAFIEATQASITETREGQPHYKDGARYMLTLNKRINITIKNSNTTIGYNFKEWRFAAFKAASPELLEYINACIFAGALERIGG